MKRSQINIIIPILFAILSANKAYSIAGQGEPLPLRAAAFSVDATPPVGGITANTSVRKIEDRVSACGIILLLPHDKPIVLCAVDAISIANSGYDQWRMALAEAAATTVERVAVHAVHQHDCPRYDFATEAMMAAHGCEGEFYDAKFGRDVISRTAKAVQEAAKNARPVTHIGRGKAKVEKVASSRRFFIDGKLKWRGSACRDPNLIAATEGLIDPYVRMVSFWDGDEPLACLMYYAVHPMSYYGKGDVTPDFVGLARNQRQKETGVLHIYFTGAAGDVAAGKYNDGAIHTRPILIGRMAAAMKQAWDSQQKQAVEGMDIQWRVQKISLPLAECLDEEYLKNKIAKTKDCNDRENMLDAAKLVWLTRTKKGEKIDLTCLKLGNSYILHMPGELFIEYQLAAQAIRPDDMVCMAAYGQLGPWYIGTAKAYQEGGYEVSPQGTLAASSAESVLMEAMQGLLK